MWLAVVQLVNVRQLVRVASLQCGDFSDLILELEYGVYLEVVVQKEDLRRCLAIVDHKLRLVGNNVEDVVRVLILELLQNDISQLRDDSEIYFNGVALRNLVEDLSETVNEISLLVIIFVEVDDFAFV